jgi:hypothetical protein
MVTGPLRFMEPSAGVRLLDQDGQVCVLAGATAATGAEALARLNEESTADPGRDQILILERVQGALDGLGRYLILLG